MPINGESCALTLAQNPRVTSNTPKVLHRIGYPPEMFARASAPVLRSCAQRNLLHKVIESVPKVIHLNRLVPLEWPDMPSPHCFQQYQQQPRKPSIWSAIRK